MAIFLVRHGETTSNAARVVQMPDTPLSARGTAQAERLARRLADEGLEVILSSDLLRARMTAQCLADASGAAIVFDPDLQERNLGALRGRPYASLTPDILAPGYEPPEGEAWADFCARIDRAWARIAAGASARDGHLAVVTHGLVCRAIAERYLTMPAGVTATGWRNTALTVIDAAPPWTVRLFNCTRHLDPP